METYLVEQQLFDNAAGVPVAANIERVPMHFQHVDPMPMPVADPADGRG